MPRSLSSTITSKGQVTIPVEVRRVLHVGPHDKVSFIVDGDQVRLVPAMGVVARTAGILKSDVPMLSPQEEKAAAEAAIAQEANGE